MLESRARCRAGHRCQPATIAEVIAHVAQHSDRRIDDVAPILFSAAQASTSFAAFVRWLRKAVSPYVATRLPAAMVGPFCRAFQNTEVVEAIARESGGVFVRLPDANLTDGAILEAHLSAVREFGQTADVLVQILPGGITDGEAALFETEVDQAIAALVALKPIVRASAETAVGVA